MSVESLASILPTDLPTPPRAALDVVRACGIPDLDARVLATMVEVQPVLALEVLRQANSAAMGFSRPVASVHAATVRLGTRGVRSAALCFAVRETVRNVSLPGVDASELWEEMVWRAAAARTVSRVTQVDGDDAYALGLMQDVGLCALMMISPDTTAHWDKLRLTDPKTRLLLETELFGRQHQEVGPILQRAWGLPELLGAAVAAHHTAAELDEPLSGLARTAAAADWIAWAFAAMDRAEAFDRVQTGLAESLGVTPELAEDLLVQTEFSIRDCAPFGVVSKRRPAFDRLLRLAVG